MRGNAKIMRFLTVLFLGVVAAAGADMLTTGRRQLDGIFVGLEDKRILFRATDGTLHSEPRTDVRSLVLDPPREVLLQHFGADDAVLVRLIEYTAGRFCFESEGKRQKAIGMRVERIALRPEAGNRADGDRERPGARAALDLSPLRNRRDLSAAQRAAVLNYQNARKAYDDFLAESSGMVAEMDRATGRRRETLLNALRLRKDQEQPVLRRMEEAEAALLAAVPRPWPVAENPAPVAGRTHSSPTSPPQELPEDALLLMDVGPLESMPGLTAKQKAALETYKAESARYQAVSADPGGPQETEAASALRKAQTELLQAFPEIRLVSGNEP